MADDVLQLVRSRNEFYRDNYKKILGLLLASVFIALIQGIGIIYLLTHPPAPKYFATDGQGRIIPLVPLDQPYLSDAVVTQWINVAVVSSFTFDFVNYRSQLQSVSSYYTPQAWQNFLEQLQSSGNLSTVISNRMMVSAVATGAPVISRQGRIENVYAWRIHLPLLITYQGTQVTQQNVVASVLVVRVSTLTNPKGIAIAQLVLAEGSSTLP